MDNVRTDRGLAVASVAPVRDITRIIHGALPRNLSFRTESLVDALILTRGRLRSADGVATRLGVADRFALRRLLRSDGLPSFRRLRSWVNVLQWTWGSSHLGQSIEQWAFMNGRSPASCYRVVRRVTGESWRVVTRRGIDWVVERFSEEVGGGSSGMAQRSRSSFILDSLGKPMRHYSRPTGKALLRDYHTNLTTRS